MNIQEAAENLRQIYHGAAERQQVVPIHLFGIKFARQLGGLTNKHLFRGAICLSPTTVRMPKDAD